MKRCHGGSYLDVVGVCEEHGEPVDAHAPSCRGWKPVLQGSAEGLINKHRLIVTFCLGLWTQNEPGGYFLNKAAC